MSIEQKNTDQTVRRFSTKIPATVVMLGLVSLFTDAASEMIYPLVPAFVALLGGGAVALGVIEGVAESTAALLKLVSGVVSDKVRKRKALVLLGYGLSTAMRPFTGLVSSAWEIVAVRMMDRVGKGIRTAPRDALIASSVDETIRGKAFGFHRSMDHAGAVAGPLLAVAAIAALAAGFGIRDPLSALRWTFILSIVPGAAAVVTIIFFVRESVPRSTSGRKLKFNFRTYDRNFVRYLFVLLLFTLGNSSDAFLLFRAEEAVRESGAIVDFVSNAGPLNAVASLFGTPEQQSHFIHLLFLPVLWSFFHIIKVIFSTPFSALSDRIGRRVTIIIGWSIYALVYAAFALLNFLPPTVQVPATIVLFAVYALYYAFTEGTEKAFVADLVGEEERGSAFGMYNFAVGLGALPASIIFGLLYSYFDTIAPGYGGTVAFGFGSLLALVSMVLLTTIVKERTSM